MDSSDWSNGIRYHIFDTRPDTEFNSGSAVYVKIRENEYVYTADGPVVKENKGLRGLSYTQARLIRPRS